MWTWHWFTYFLPSFLFIFLHHRKDEKKSFNRKEQFARLFLSSLFICFGKNLKIFKITLCYPFFRVSNFNLINEEQIWKCFLQNFDFFPNFFTFILTLLFIFFLSLTLLKFLPIHFKWVLQNNKNWLVFKIQKFSSCWKCKLLPLTEQLENWIWNVGTNSDERSF